MLITILDQQQEEMRFAFLQKNLIRMKTINEFEIGKVKVVWIDVNPNFIYSKMFNNLEQALLFSKSKKEYLVFELVKQNNMEEFRWKLLPHGKFDLYTSLFNLYQKRGLKRLFSLTLKIK